MNTVYIGLGSNLSDPAKQIQLAVDAIGQIKCSTITALSSLYFSRPMGPADQPDYMNAVLELSTELAPLALLDELQHIENNAGRIRKDNRWGPRILDLDIILFGNQEINCDRLTVPHYGMREREFVILPLLEIAQELTLPDGTKITTLSQQIDDNGLKIYGNLHYALRNSCK
ncbi:2-amino-4-hydroxy-6-hydroxymethyldihydropteridine diphosphokinase [Thalassotalea sp. M1531]|uniref:2-amino-4-hydroxy-6-hydroxymethyldihydropteridine pyrophosphokinase n=1 Tax=Thalassotalea algicola TaxID=2716224 RepID=A0A7Y0LCK6_9GAMM|nr:2-amino-4-hydroxy-6-hydroxymethyldihydropteridine diphosphokinase [Thalassotalea algicola]NMP31822.1 2-amino-4-hydroxy-6-hydroxymethyldihydropteridine diphosphokinase [Thalassotalea algicola]